MYLLEGKPAPDNATIARFISLHLAQCSKELMAESTWLLRRNGLFFLRYFPVLETGVNDRVYHPARTLAVPRAYNNV
jgi:hypothetical protein